MTRSFPVLLITGPVGAGKSTVAAEASRLLSEVSVRHAVIDLAQIANAWPERADDPWNERLLGENLACMWANFRAVGVDRLILCKVLEHQGGLRRIASAVPGAEIIVIRLRVPLAVLEARIRQREAGRDPSWFLGAASRLYKTLEQTALDHHVVDNDNRAAADTAAETLRLAGWLNAPPGTSSPPMRG